jgi:ubiquinone/menaquinone biosynthesis C-methylase UbiE
MEYYDTIAPGYDELHKGEQLKKYRFIEKYLGIGKDDSLLDVGCGTGLSSEIFRCGITGIDSSKDMLDEAKNSLRKAAFVQGKAEHLPFKNEAFDIIICISAFHNFKGLRKALEEMKRVGKGKGAITIMRKAKKAKELRTLVEKVFNIEKVVDEDKDIILFFGIA